MLLLVHYVLLGIFRPEKKGGGLIKQNGLFSWLVYHLVTKAETKLSTDKNVLKNPTSYERKAKTKQPECQERSVDFGSRNVEGWILRMNLHL